MNSRIRKVGVTAQPPNVAASQPASDESVVDLRSPCELPHPYERNTPLMQSSIGSHKLELDTPLLCLDLPAMEGNIRAMAQFIVDRGKLWRPHMKCHKSPTIALKQLAAGAIGLTCGKVSEAEVMAAAGIRDLMIANMIVGQPKL